ncbi:MAG: TolC family protein [bacterium]
MKKNKCEVEIATERLARKREPAKKKFLEAGLIRARVRRFDGLLLLLVQMAFFALPVMAQSGDSMSIDNPQTMAPSTRQSRASLTRYLDPKNGMSADEAVAFALAHNGELLAAREEIEAARGLIKQASLKPNPTLDIERKQQLNGTDNDTMIGGTLPLELGGRRSARVAVVQQELELGEKLFADRERLLAAEVRAKFGEALGHMLKLGFTEDLLSTSDRGYRLVVARVTEGRTAPLEQNMVLVEVNRIRSLREVNEGKVEVSLLELRNLIGMPSEEPLRLRGDLDHLVEPLPSLTISTELALRDRTDLQAARVAETLAEARIEQARAAGRLDASVNGKYELMNFGFPQRGFDSQGRLVPIQGTFHSVAVGVTLDLPVRNRNQGAIEAAVAKKNAAMRRREFAELTVRRDVASAFARYQRAARAAEIYRVGVREQANANLDVIRQTYELGSKSLLDYISEQRRYIEVETGYIDSLLDTYAARVEIQRATASPELIKR